MVYVRKESRGQLATWALGPVAGIVGLIVLLIGTLVFRRALGPRRASDKYFEVNKTKAVDKNETRRFGEAGGEMDDGTVDSAFYSDSDGEIEETEKERKMRRKRKEKSELRSSSRKLGRQRSSNNLRKSGRSASKHRRSLRKSLSISQGSDDTKNTEALGSSLESFKDSASDDMEDGRERARALKEQGSDLRASSRSLKQQRRGSESDLRESSRSSKQHRRSSEQLRRSSSELRSSRRSSRSSSEHRNSLSKSKRGRNRQSGGDNARIV